MCKPTCINKYCHKEVDQINAIFDEWGERNYPIYRSTCNHCHKSKLGYHAYASGVIPILGRVCDNINGNAVGTTSPCPVNWDLVDPDVPGMLEVDHIDGNHFNNSPENIQILCPMCHRQKSSNRGDYGINGSGGMDPDKIIQRQSNRGDTDQRRERDKHRFDQVKKLFK
jgi:hypothetical protein